MKPRQTAPALYKTLLPLFKTLDFSLVVHSVLEGSTPGWVYADDDFHPKAAMLWDRQSSIVLAGGPPSTFHLAAVLRILNDQILPDARPRGVPEMTLYTTPTGWAGHAPQLLAGLEPEQAQRTNFAFSALPDGWRERVPADFAIVPIDAALFETARQNLDQVRGWVDSYWPTTEVFLRDGFGACAVQGDTIAAWCLTVYAADNRRELGMATAPDFQGRGLATAAACATVEQILAAGFTPEWHCWTDNPASARVAEKAGFVQERVYNVYRFKTGL
jgi:GNAT superfamily N-acetyltransferase